MDGGRLLALPAASSSSRWHKITNLRLKNKEIWPSAGRPAARVENYVTPQTFFSALRTINRTEPRLYGCMRANDLTSDAELIRAWQQGDPSAFDRLLLRYQTPLFTYLLRLVQERSDAEDLFQETFLRVIRALPGYQERARFGSWLFGIAHRLAIDHHRKERYRRVTRPFNESGAEGLPPSGVTPGSAQERLEMEELDGRITAALRDMPVSCREVFLLRQHGELTFREIADLLDRPLNTVLGQMRQALLHLRQTIGKEYV